MSRGRIGSRAKIKIVDENNPWLDARFFTLIDFLLYLSSIEQASIFLNAFLTDYERHALLQRWHILIYLQTTELTYEEIAKELGCSTKTVMRIASRCYYSSEIRRMLRMFISSTEEELEEKKDKGWIKILKRMKGGDFWVHLLKDDYQEKDLIKRLTDISSPDRKIKKNKGGRRRKTDL